MSSIEKMTIQGIRSYGPKENDTQVIEFFFPVTLIIGQNGSGKTTIIECLKYVTTGDMPPNTKGSSFVFDPKLIDAVETKGRVKLYFRDTSDLYVQVQKNLCNTQKAKKLEFRTIETIISRYSKENKLMSTITSKCINADAEIINAFGVSKAVLEHVIFCHQEDSNWPLSEGKLLKTRFDEIFAATKYIKALDCLRKVRLEKQQLAKQKDIEKKFLESNKTRCEQLQTDLATNETKYESFKDKKEAIVEKLKPIEKQIEFYFQESARIIEVKQELDKIENERALLEKQIKELLLTTKHCLFSGTDDELKEHIREFEQKTNKMRKEQEEANLKRIDELNHKLKELNVKKSKLTIEIGGVENKQKTNNENKTKLNGLLQKAADLMSFSSTIDDLSLEQIDDFISEYQSETNRLEELKKKEDNELQNKIDTERDLKSKMDQSIKNKNDLIEKNTKQLDHIKSELQYVSNDSLLNNLNREINQLESDILNKSKIITDNNQIKQDLNELESKRSDLRNKEINLDLKIAELHADAKHQTEINLLKQDKQSKEEQIRKIRLRIKDDLETFFEDDFESDLRNDFNLKSVYETKLKSVLNDLNIYETKKKEIEKRLTSNEAQRKIHFDELRKKETQLREYEDKLMQLDEFILSLDDIQNYDSIFQKLQETHRALLDENGYLNGVDKTYKRFLAQLQESKSITDKLAKSVDSDCVSCPVCLRLFKDQSELDETIRELKKYSSKLPQKMKDLDSKINESEIKIQKMIQMKPTKETYEKLKNHEIASLKSQLDQLDRNVLPKIKQELKVNQESLEKLEKLKSCSELLQNELVLIDKYANECKDLNKKIDSQMVTLNKLNANNEGSSLDDLNMMKSEMQTELQSLNKRIQSKQDELNSNYTLTDKLNELKEKLNGLKTKRNDLESKMQKKTQLNEKQRELLDENEQAEIEIVSLNEQLKQLIDKICNLTQKRQNQLNSNRDLFKERIKLLNELTTIKNNCDDLSQCIRNFEQNDSNKLVCLRKDIKTIEISESEINVELETIREELDELKSELARHDIKQRELMDNLKLREKRVEYELKKEAFLKKKEEIKLNDSKLDLNQFKIEQAKVEAKRDELTQEYNQIKTQMNIIEGKIQTIKDELEQDVYKSALEKYSVCASDLRVLEVAVIDIEKYYKALDRAVMNYHLIKMNEINKTIKQLWRQVYKGNDIDYIEIRSEEENEDEDAQQIKQRRVYNYRVVLVKGETSLDMRGRCSAGQKVLASIIIRLALAETFCLNSGILALDEPTTNLDRENIESLASALVEIIKTRSSQKNFQLIIITHDEDFVEMLGRSEYMDQYYRVYKDENGFSRISKRSNLSL